MTIVRYPDGRCMLCGVECAACRANLIERGHLDGGDVGCLHGDMGCYCWECTVEMWGFDIDSASHDYDA
jgi:hypothetical protein